MDNTNDKNNTDYSSPQNTSDDTVQPVSQDDTPNSHVDDPSVTNDQEVSDLQKEIQAQFSAGTDMKDNTDNTPIQKQDTDEVASTPKKEEQPYNLDSNVGNDKDFPFPSIASKRQPSVEGEPPQETPLTAIENPGNASTPVSKTVPESEQETIENLQKDIKDEFSNSSEAETTFPQDRRVAPPVPEQEEPEQVAQDPKLGIGDTYYSDLNKAMSANEPSTMSELIQQSSYEQKEKAVLSPTSKKNLMYIFGTIFFLIISVVAWLLVFGTSEDQPEFITKERVNSLVFSDEDLGINATGLQTFETKSAIRSVVERDNSSDSVSQIYYVQEDDMGNLRRMGIKDIFDRTESEVPELLYDNIENEFMHGVYTTDKNYPFIIIKALSYDRAFDGMRQWEPTMIDDLATYFDLPAEAVDRSLLQDGFSDDLIKNKNVRVVRYIPRESDRRSILEFFQSDGTEFQENQDEDEVDLEEDPFDSFFQDLPGSEDNLSQRMFDVLMFPLKVQSVYAQDIGGTFLDDTLNEQQGATNTVCYRANKVCIDLLTGNQLSGSTTPSTTVACYDSIFDPENPDQVGETFTPQEVEGQPGFICREVLAGGDSVSGTQEIDSLYTDLVCFDRFSGDRLPPLDEGASYEQSSSSVCFEPYRCNRVACFRDGREVASSNEGQPGVSCRATNEVVDPQDDVRKSCVQFNELLTLEKINNLNLCFDQTGRFVPVDSRIENLEDYYINYAATSDQSVQQVLETGGGVQCISPQSLNSRLCVTTTGDVIPGVTTSVDGSQVPVSENDPNIELCFEPFNSGNLSEEFNSNINTDIRQKLAAISHQLRNLAVLASGFGYFPNDVSETLDEAADVLWEISVANLLENEIVMKVAEVTRTLELLLNRIDPGAPNSEVTRELREIIAFIKTVLGLQNNAAWVTIGNDLPQGVNIYQNGQVTGGTLSAQQTTDAIEAVQQSLVLLGLMKPVSVTGELDLVTQQALQFLQEINGFVDGNEELSPDQIFISAEMLQLIQQMVEGSSTLYGGETTATIDTYFGETLGLGKYSNEVQQLQIILYTLGYDISGFDGIFDEEVCLAVQKYQMDNGLEVADTQECILSAETINSLNEDIREKNYLGSGFAIGSNGALEGTGEFLGTFGPGTVNYEVNQAEASSLREGDIVLMYTFLDEETILIARHESVITEIIRRRSLSDIFSN